CGDGPCTWTVTEKDGTVYTYGGPQASSAAIARWVNGSPTASIRVWALAIGDRIAAIFDGQASSFVHG
ncbi:MAG TPA: hypothetical protein VGH52_02515, partial [Gaiellaceae bacterium]